MSLHCTFHFVHRRPLRVGSKRRSGGRVRHSRAKQGAADRVAGLGKQGFSLILKGTFALVAEPKGCRNCHLGCFHRTGS